MMTSTFKALVDVDFAKLTHGAMRTSTFEIVDQIVADSVVLTWIAIAVIDVVFAILALIAFGTNTVIVANEIFARGSVLAGIA